ncbi:MAG: GGDEF domain-containing protein [Archangium sp.]|nr:GGDEF domain-containing protein [Archangium sp.]MDP3153882.1 GGDEF domain-containing protein [Archangium sp.]MDP3569383.1 GGDEF domain-containing protein [Archangium sp.]
MALFPTAQGRPDGPTWLVDQLVDAELHRRGSPDSVTGAIHALALNQGQLLKEEFDLSTHGHSDGWVIGAVLIDPLEFTLFNMRYGFKAGDVAMRAMVEGMKEVCPSAKVVRLHTDGFAVLLGPTADQKISADLLPRLREVLPAKVAAVTPKDAEAERRVVFTFGLLELTVVDPPNWQILGPLVWAECERALVIARRQPTEALQLRRVTLDGRLPEMRR